MCMMCEQEALYDAYLEYVARKEAEAAAKGETIKGDVIKSPLLKSQGFSAEAIDEDASEELPPDDPTVLRAPPVATSRKN